MIFNITGGVYMKEYIYAQAIQKREVQTRLAMSLVQLIEHL